MIKPPDVIIDKLLIFVKLHARDGCGIRGCNMDVKKELYDQKIRDVYRNVWVPERHVKNINLYIITKKNKPKTSS